MKGALFTIFKVVSKCALQFDKLELMQLTSDSLYYLQFCNKLKCDKSELIGLDDFSQGHFRIPETGIRVFILS